MIVNDIVSVMMHVLIYIVCPRGEQTRLRARVSISCAGKRCGDLHNATGGVGGLTVQIRERFERHDLIAKRLVCEPDRGNC